MENSLFLFIMTSLALIIAPGPDMLYVIGRSVAQGKKAGLLSSFGVSLGILIHTLAAAFGLSVILANSEIAYNVIRYFGAAYLIYLGVLAFKKETHSEKTMVKVSTNKLVLQGLFSNVFNPKVSLFFISFLPQFVSPQSPNPEREMIYLGGLFFIMGLFILIVITFMAAQFRRMLNSGSPIARRLNWIMGAILIFLGVRLAFSRL